MTASTAAYTGSSGLVVAEGLSSGWRVDHTNHADLAMLVDGAVVPDWVGRVDFYGELALLWN